MITKKENLHCYMSDKDKKIFNKFVTDLCSIGRTKARRGDAIAAILIAAVKDPDHIKKIRDYMYK